MKETTTKEFKFSSIRITLIWGMGLITLPFIGIFIRLLDLNAKIDYSGMGILITTLAAFIGTLVYGKVKQKKTEVENKSKE
jgi:hypothetical protein